MEEFEEDEESDSMNIVTDDPKKQRDIEMALQFGEESDEASSAHSSGPEELTPYQQKQQRLRVLIDKYERELVAKKHWRMMGETTAGQREVDALLHDLPEFELREKPHVQITDELNQQIEELLKQRVLDKNFDNAVFADDTHDKKEDLKEVNTNKAERGLGDVVTGRRAEVPELILKKRKECQERYGELETELRRYFIGSYYQK